MNTMANYAQFASIPAIFSLSNLVFNILCHFLIATHPTFKFYGILFILFLTYLFCSILEFPSLVLHRKLKIKTSIHLSFFFRYLGLFIFFMALKNSSWYFLFLGTIIDALSIILLNSPLEGLFKEKKDTYTLRIFSLITLPLCGLFYFISPQFFPFSLILIFSMLSIKFIQHLILFTFLKKIPELPISKDSSNLHILQKIKLLYLFKDKILLYSFGHILYRISTIYFIAYFFSINTFTPMVNIFLIFFFYFIIFSLKRFIKNFTSKTTPIIFFVLGINLFFLFYQGSISSSPNFYILFVYIFSQIISSLKIMELNQNAINQLTKKEWISTWISYSNVFTFGFISLTSLFSLLATDIPTINIPIFLMLVILSIKVLLIDFFKDSSFNLHDYLQAILWIITFILQVFLFIIFSYLFLQYKNSNTANTILVSILLGFIVSGLIIKLFNKFVFYLLDLVNVQFTIFHDVHSLTKYTPSQLEQIIIFEDLRLLASKIKNFVDVERKYIFAQGAIETIEHLAHEIRRPFIQFKLFFSCLQNSTTQEEITLLLKNYAPLINPNFMMVENLLEDLTTLNATSYLCFDKLEILDLKNLITTSYHKIMHSIPNAHLHHFVFHINERLNNNWFYLDSSKIQRVFENIFQNCFEELQSLNIQQATLWVTLSLLVEEEKILEIRIKNTDTFIEKNNLEKIFLSHFTKNKQQGKGLGLAICAKIIHDHQGRIQCFSEKIKDSNESYVEFVIRFKIY